jgi:hypothetical protein
VFLLVGDRAKQLADNIESTQLEFTLNNDWVEESQIFFRLQVNAYSVDESIAGHKTSWPIWIAP